MAVKHSTNPRNKLACTSLDMTTRQIKPVIPIVTKMLLIQGTGLTYSSVVGFQEET